MSHNDSFKQTANQTEQEHGACSQTTNNKFSECRTLPNHTNKPQQDRNPWYMQYIQKSGTTTNPAMLTTTFRKDDTSVRYVVAGYACVLSSGQFEGKPPPNIPPTCCEAMSTLPSIFFRTRQASGK